MTLPGVTGASAIETSFVDDYSTSVELLVQQRGSKLRNSVTVKNFTGKGAAFIEQVGVVDAQVKVSRHSDTPLIPTPYDRRWVYPVDREIADLVDDQDRLRQIINPDDPIAKAQAFAIGRSIDDEIIDQIMTANNTGVDGSTSTSFIAGNAIASASVGMTINKLREAKYLLENANVDFDMEEVCCIITPKQKQQLLATTEITSSDYNTVKALAQGEVDTFLGFKFITSTRLSGGPGYVGSTAEVANTDLALIYAKSGVGLGIWGDVSARIDERPDKGYATQVYCKATFGATRLQEEKVISIATLNNV